MSNIKFRSIRNQLTATTVLTCGIVLLLAFASLAAFEIISARRATIEELSALAKIVGHNVAGALAFNDANYAEGMLSALSAKQPIEYADIHAQDGRVFAIYDPRGIQREVLEHRGATTADLDHETIGSFLLESFKFFAVSDHVDISGPIALNNETIGEIHLRSNLADVKSKVAFYFLIAGGGHHTAMPRVVSRVIQAAPGHLRTDHQSRRNDEDRCRTKGLRGACAQAP